MSFFDAFSSLQDKPSISSLLFLFVAGELGVQVSYLEWHRQVMLEIMSGILMPVFRAKW